MINKYLHWLNQHQFHGIKPGLYRIQRLLKKLGYPQKKYPTIHVAGTNGKGSTCAILSTVLTHLGLKTGLYTSPHLIKLNERFKINGKDIEDTALLELLKLLYFHVEEPITYFELTTALAFLYFAEENVDIAVIEVGLGGRLDATNVITPEVSIITTIGFDHTKYLGSALESIAFEKSGIIKRKKPLLLGNIPSRALEVIIDRALKLDAPYYILNKDFFVYLNNDLWTYIGKHIFPNLNLSLKGTYQGENLALALKTLEILEDKDFIKIEEPLLREALTKVYWEGRYKRINLSQKEILIDCAHNMEGVLALKNSFEKEGFYPYLLLIGATNEDGEKPFSLLYKILSPYAQKVFFTEFSSERKIVTIEDWKSALNLDNRKSTQNFQFFKDPSLALITALKERVDKILITGSIYFVGEILKVIKGIKND
ncbi:MAG: bifunctional folylpolyglutamate synthase/dihydrofolate synthase [Caldimicrobium sp.]